MCNIFSLTFPIDTVKYQKVIVTHLYHILSSLKAGNLCMWPTPGEPGKGNVSVNSVLRYVRLAGLIYLNLGLSMNDMAKIAFFSKQ